MSNSDQKEFETKVLDINPSDVIRRLRQLKASETTEFLYRRYVFDLASKNIEWIRLRQNPGQTTLTYKHKVRGNTKIGQTIEIEVEVSDFDKTASILSKLPFKRVFYQENKCHIFSLNGIEFSINTWPLLKPYLEIESSHEEKVAAGLKLLGLSGKDAGDQDIKEIYQDQGIDLHAYPELKFA